MECYTHEIGKYTVGYFNPAKGKGHYSEIIKNPRVCFVKLPSDRAFALGEIPRNLDFVYVDGLHTPDQAYRDIMNSLNFVKIGGVVGGHDFTREYEQLVLPAVLRVAAETGLVPTVKMPDFWFVKTED